MPDQFPLEPKPMAAPKRINGCIVLASMRREQVEGEIADQYEVICYDGKGDLDMDSEEFVVWRIGFQRHDGYHGKWVAMRGHYQLTWERARKVFAERSGIDSGRNQ
jgi:hypothetical protein